MACPRGTYSMGGYTDCLPCPAGWLCQEGLAVPCGYGTTYTSVSTGAQDEEGFSTSETDIYGGVCVSCPPGGQCPGGGVWEECPPGTFSSGGDASIVCQLCSPGTFANRTAMVECQSCAAGEICLWETEGSRMRSAVGEEKATSVCRREEHGHIFLPVYASVVLLMIVYTIASPKRTSMECEYAVRLTNYHSSMPSTCCAYVRRIQLTYSACTDSLRYVLLQG